MAKQYDAPPAMVIDPARRYTATISTERGDIVVELYADKDGMSLPASIAPFEVVVTPVKASDVNLKAAAEKLYAELTAKGVDVIIDDRADRPGVKFKDSELVGFPIRVGVGEKSLAKGEVEVKPRGGALMPVKAEEAVEKVLALIAASGA